MYCICKNYALHGVLTLLNHTVLTMPLSSMTDDDIFNLITQLQIYQTEFGASDACSSRTRHSLYPIFSIVGFIISKIYCIRNMRDLQLPELHIKYVKKYLSKSWFRDWFMYFLYILNYSKEMSSLKIYQYCHAFTEKNSALVQKILILNWMMAILF